MVGRTALFLVLFLVPYAAQAADVLIVSQVSGKCIAWNGGASLSQRACTKGVRAANQFHLEPTAVAGEFTIVANEVGAGKRCMDVDAAATSDGAAAAVSLYPCHGQDNQIFKVKEVSDGEVALIAKHSSMCLDIASASADDGAALVQYNCHFGANQQFSLQAPSRFQTHFNWAVEDDIEHDQKQDVHCYEYDAQGIPIGRSYVPEGASIGRFEESNEACERSHPSHPVWQGPGVCRSVTPSGKVLPTPIHATYCSATAALAPGLAAPTAESECAPGFVRRNASPFDLRCVSPEVREQTLAENQAALSHCDNRDLDRCKEGYVWREAFSGDHVCISREAKARVRKDLAADDAAIPLARAKRARQLLEKWRGQERRIEKSYETQAKALLEQSDEPYFCAINCGSNPEREGDLEFSVLYGAGATEKDVLAGLIARCPSTASAGFDWDESPTSPTVRFRPYSDSDKRPCTPTPHEAAKRALKALIDAQEKERLLARKCMFAVPPEAADQARALRELAAARERELNTKLADLKPWADGEGAFADLNQVGADQIPALTRDSSSLDRFAALVVSAETDLDNYKNDRAKSKTQCENAIDAFSGDVTSLRSFANEMSGDFRSKYFEILDSLPSADYCNGWGGLIDVGGDEALNSARRALKDLVARVAVSARHLANLARAQADALTTFPDDCLAKYPGIDKGTAALPWGDEAILPPGRPSSSTGAR